jgi:predicted CopG family antitoxin
MNSLSFSLSLTRDEEAESMFASDLIYRYIGLKKRQAFDHARPAMGARP